MESDFNIQPNKIKSYTLNSKRKTHTTKASILDIGDPPNNFRSKSKRTLIETHFSLKAKDQSEIKDEKTKNLEEEQNLHILNKYRNISYQLSTKDKLNAFLEGVFYKVFYVLVTIYVLYADDIKMLSFDKTADLSFSCIAIVIMFIFLVEIVFYFIVYDNEYACSLFFWIDLAGLASMVLDLHWVSDIIVLHFSSENKKTVYTRFYNLVRLARGVRIVTRAIRMIRILKLMKLFKNKNKATVDEIAEDEIDQGESKVGQKLEELTLKRMVILILLMIFSIIFFSPSFYYNPKTIMDFGIQMFNDIPVRSPLFNLTFNVYIQESINTDVPIIYVKAYDLEWGNKTLGDLLRPSEKIEVTDLCSNYALPDDLSTKQCLAIFDNKIHFQFACIMNIIKTVFICIVLAGGIICFSKDTNDLVLEPIAKMTQKIKNLSKNPIAAMQQNLNENEEQSEEKGITGKTLSKAMACCWFSNKKEAPLETTILEKTISKISTLLALGFGEAGAEIISKNMQKGGDGDVNPMLSGKKVMAVYGFCDIRNFTDTTEVLQEKVMIFVNEIAEIVHEITSLYCGSANKNIGDAFLLVWKFDEKFVEKSDAELKLIKNKTTSQLVDMALIAFLKILAAVHKSYKLNVYRSHPGLCERIYNYSVKMGFGLHLGYSIEGAIGSMFKIDASYLSPNVNMASKLEEKTKEYRVQLILSEDFVNYLSDDARKFVRLIDQIKSKDNHILNFDLNALQIEECENESEVKEEDLCKKMETIKVNREKRKMLYDDAVNGKKEVWKDFVENDSDWSLMRRKFTKEFYDYYNEGIKYYVKGDWVKAREYFLDANVSRLY